MQERTLLVAVDEESLRRRLQESLSTCGYCTIESTLGSVSCDSIRKAEIDLLIMATPECPAEALALARHIRESGLSIPIILLANKSSEELAITAIKAGVNDYFKSPVHITDVLASIKSRLPTKPVLLQKAPGFLNDGMVGNGAAMQQIRTCISRLAACGSNVLLTGETGTGKELVAELIHRSSSRARQPFVRINCAAVPDTLLESEFFGHERGAFTGAQFAKQGQLRLAEGGSVFFDEIGDMTPYAQAKILRAIERKEVQPLGGRNAVPVDFRVIAATNHDLEQLSAQGSFRQDLYFRLNVGRIHLPPLRERKEDIPTLIEHYIAEFNRDYRARIEGCSSEALTCLLHYHWPGNVRELKNLLEATFVDLSAGTISLRDLPEVFRRRVMEAESLPPNERDHLLATLLATNWNKSKAAEKLNWSRMTLYRKLAKYQISGNLSSNGSHENRQEKT